MPENELLRQAWKEANDRVREAEDRLGTAWTAFSAGQAGPPDAALLAEVARLRRECDARLAAILDGFQDRKPSARKGAERPGAR